MSLTPGEAVVWIEALAAAPVGLDRPLVWLTRDPAPQPARPPDLTDAAPLGAERGARRLIRRGLLRALAARVLDAHPDRIEIAREASGRLRLTAPEPLFVSHAGRAGWTATALARAPIGVDVELAAPEPPLPLDLLHASERERLTALPTADRARAFARLWAVKEAFAKASGRGLDEVLAHAPAREAAGGTFRIEGRTAQVRDFGEVIAAVVVLGDAVAGPPRGAQLAMS